MRGKLGLLLMGRASLSKSLIQFSVDGQSRVPSLLFDPRPNYGGGNEDNGFLLHKVPCRHCYRQLSAPSSSTGHRLPTPLPETPGHSWASPGQSLWGHCSFLLGPRAHNVLFVPSKSLFPQSYVSSGSSMVGLMATSSKRAYATPRSAAPRVPAPAAGHCSPGPPQETLYLGLFGVSGSWCIQGLFVPILSKVR